MLIEASLPVQYWASNSVAGDAPAKAMGMATASLVNADNPPLLSKLLLLLLPQLTPEVIAGGTTPTAAA